MRILEITSIHTSFASGMINSHMIDSAKILAGCLMFVLLHKVTLTKRQSFSNINNFYNESHIHKNLLLILSSVYDQPPVLFCSDNNELLYVAAVYPCKIGRKRHHDINRDYTKCHFCVIQITARK